METNARACAATSLSPSALEALRGRLPSSQSCGSSGNGTSSCTSAYGGCTFGQCSCPSGGKNTHQATDGQTCYSCPAPPLQCQCTSTYGRCTSRQCSCPSGGKNTHQTTDGQTCYSCPATAFPPPSCVSSVSGDMSSVSGGVSIVSGGVSGGVSSSNAGSASSSRRRSATADLDGSSGGLATPHLLVIGGLLVVVCMCKGKKQGSADDGVVVVNPVRPDEVVVNAVAVDDYDAERE